jgi:hypothetical protein
MMKFLYLKRGRTSSTDAYTSALDTRLRVSKKKKGGQVVSAAMGYSFIPELTDKNGEKKS